MKILLSIKPEFAEKILAGVKLFEFRKTNFDAAKIEKVIIYATMPVGKIVGEFEVECVLSDRPSAVWEMTKREAGISRDFFMSYYTGKTRAYALKVQNPKRYARPLSLAEAGCGTIAPQSFRYVS